LFDKLIFVANHMSYKHQTVAVIIPAFNESQSIGLVVSELLALKDPVNGLGIIDDLIVCNNASTDQTESVARKAGAMVINEFRQGYGFACLRAIDMLERQQVKAPDIVVFVDADHSVVASELPLLLDAIQQGGDLVVGSRAGHLQERESMSAHQRFGNYLASSLIRKLWSVPISDLGPFRAIRYRALRQLNMQDQRFGWTVEMQVKAIQAKMNYVEIPITTLRRIGASKISGTIMGTLGAAIGIFSMVFKLYFQESHFLASLKSVSE
jgi:glycosyltransferase involved in cell wall biosynthesis